MKYSVLILLLIFALLPSVTRAQQIVPKFPDMGSLSRERLYEEGPEEDEPVLEEDVQDHRRRSSDFDRKIDDLADTPNYQVLMPVLFGIGVRDIFPNYGDPRSGGRLHEGEDIIAVKGTPVVSPTDAVVLRVGFGSSAGNYVRTANPGGESFVYMHLDRIGEGVDEGDVLSKGSLIGYIGNTGNASGGPAHLHFEIHNSSGAPTDPFPRLTEEFTLQEKMYYLSTILSQTSDPTALSQLLAANFRGTFTNALAANVSLPLSVSDALATIPVSPVAVARGSLPSGDLDIGSSGATVSTLQRYLIQDASGVAAARLATAGATGYFGVVTKAALIEFQAKVGIAPSSGYYGATTRDFIVANPQVAQALPSVYPTPSVPNAPVQSGTTVGLTRDLTVGSSGEDVRTLQIVLNANGYAVASVGAGSPGNESIYFGPATRAAVIRFQIARGITPAVGYVGPLTRAALATTLAD